MSEQLNHHEYGIWGFVPMWATTGWYPHPVQIIGISEEWGLRFYCRYQDPVSQEVKTNYFYESEVFQTHKDCVDFIPYHFYDKYCEGCKYRGFEADYRCSSCVHLTSGEYDEENKECPKICGKTGLLVSRQEICHDYIPSLPQYKASWNGWESYIDILKNCNFNTCCPLHKNSCHKTCTFDKYINELMPVAVKSEHNGRKLRYVKVKRKDWMNQEYEKTGDLEAYYIAYAYEKGRNGKPLKKDLPIVEYFDEPVKIRIKEENQ